jgi:hypothetical protein
MVGFGSTGFSDAEGGFGQKSRLLCANELSYGLVLQQKLRTSLDMIRHCYLSLVPVMEIWCEISPHTQIWETSMGNDIYDTVSFIEVRGNHFAGV